MRFAAVAAALLVMACATSQTAPPAQGQAPSEPPAAAPASPVPAAIAPDPHASLDPTDAPAGAYTLDPRHASVIWRVRHGGLSLYTARFDTISGTLNFDPQNPANSSVTATIAASSVSTGLRNRQGDLAFDREVANVLGAATNPDITFRSRSVTLTGAAGGLIAGDLTLNGQTHPVTLEASFEGGRFSQVRGKHVLAFAGRTIIDRSQWGAGSTLFDIAAGDQVEILIQAEFMKD
jgi:polyisoprenoid-binding protein YceI